MVRTCRKLGALLTAWALTALAAAAPTGASAPVPDFSGLPVQLAAAGSEMDFHTREVLLTKVAISQGNTRVSAEHARATGLNFANSKWNFEGNVRIDGERRGSLRSDQAVVEFKDNHIARAIVTGKPAEFEQQRADSDQIARGHADEIVYDLSDGTVRLKDDAWLCDGQAQISGPLLVYNIREQRIEAASAPGAVGTGDQRVHISIAAARTARPEASACAPAKSETPPAPKQSPAGAEAPPHP